MILLMKQRWKLKIRNMILVVPLMICSIIIIYVKPNVIKEDVCDAEEDKYVPKKKKKQKDEKYQNICYKCKICNNTFINETTFNIHKKIHQKDMEYTCDLCKETFDTNDHLLKHKKTRHINDNDCYLCQKCKMAFSDHRSYINHRIVHLKPPYKCFECNFQFTKKNSLNAHIFMHYNIENECSICKEMVHHKKMATHLEKHNTIQCIECGKNVKKSFHSYHMLVHTGVKKYQCWYCGQGFFSSAQRAVHTRKHTGERPYSCKQCNRTFTQSVDLRRHLIQHKQSAEHYECDHCGKKYSVKQSLITHMRIHSNYKPYKCPFCSQRFHTSTYLTLHTYKKHVKENRFKCNFCNKSFKTNTDLGKHVKTKEHQKMAYKHTINV
ncbi:zinc finger protein 93-like isoform X2 [Zerene cesonia]|uniref:zinc finger protein 93-like isoform X2 n=1 Tax=Zerene cesonia TaxID=33412 RepID=UPI0018E57156|nr:zinc finger protein 93-like isoform X2 [Zerene cesonia]